MCKNKTTIFCVENLNYGYRPFNNTVPMRLRKLFFLSLYYILIGEYYYNKENRNSSFHFEWNLKENLHISSWTEIKICDRPKRFCLDSCIFLTKIFVFIKHLRSNKIFEPFENEALWNEQQVKMTDDKMKLKTITSIRYHIV